jgi:hypothetical protein
MNSDFSWLVASYWWLIFPLMGFAFGAFGMWMGYRVHRDRMDLMKTYASQGKDPAEIAKIMGGPASGAPDPYWGGGYPMGRHYWGGPWAWGYWGRWGPYREWRRFILFVCLAVGFGVASRYSDIPGTEHAFTLVAIIMSVLAIGSFLFAILATVFAANASKNDK